MSLHKFASREELHRHSIDHPDWFWGAVIDFLDVSFLESPSAIFDDGASIDRKVWFPDGVINLAHACLNHWTNSQTVALIDEDEDGEVRTWTGSRLLSEVQMGASVLVGAGLRRGDRVGVFLPFCAEGVIAVLSIAWAGGVAVPMFSGFGSEALKLRLRDSGSSILISGDFTIRKRKRVPLLAVALEAVTDLGAKVKLIAWPRFHDEPLPDGIDSWIGLSAQVSPQTQPARTAAEDPVLIAYTSGTTGRPKGIVHVHGGLTVKLCQEGAFQWDVHEGDRISWITDLGWIMSLWTMVSALANRACLALYSGSPDFPSTARVMDFAERHRLTSLGMSPTLVRTMMGNPELLNGHGSLETLRLFGSTGEPWSVDAWWWLFQDVGHGRIPIVNFTGGTEVGASFLSVSLTQGLKPLSVGTPCLGMDVAVFTPSGPGQISPCDVPGELVCRSPWPSMARTVWKDHDRFLETYWSVWPETWFHGDLASYDSDGFWFLYGRSDDVIKIAGKRVGPSEIEDLVSLSDEVVEAVAVGVPDPLLGTAISVCVVLLPGLELDGTVSQQLRDRIVNGLGKPFAPQDIVQIPAVPRTRSGKAARRVLRAWLTGEGLGDISTIDGIDQLGEPPPPRRAQTKSEQPSHGHQASCD